MLDHTEARTATLGNAEDLRAYYGPTTSFSVRKEQPGIDRHARAFIERSPFVGVSTASADGWPEAWPRGDAPGFVAVEGPNRLLLPDRPGNNRLHSLQNVLEDGKLGLLFLVPRITHTLRVYGTARILTDEALRTRFAASGKPARCVVGIAVQLAYFSLRQGRHPLRPVGRREMALDRGAGRVRQDPVRSDRRGGRGRGERQDLRELHRTPVLSAAGRGGPTPCKSPAARPSSQAAHPASDRARRRRSTVSATRSSSPVAGNGRWMP